MSANAARRATVLAPVATLLGQEPTRRTRKIDEANLHNDKNMHTDT
jgi:hypothetical protein